MQDGDSKKAYGVSMEVLRFITNVLSVCDEKPTHVGLQDIADEMIHIFINEKKCVPEDGIEVLKMFEDLQTTIDVLDISVYARETAMIRKWENENK